MRVRTWMDSLRTCDGCGREQTLTFLLRGSGPPAPHGPRPEDHGGWGESECRAWAGSGRPLARPDALVELL